jgi:hypothetical protein
VALVRTNVSEERIASIIRVNVPLKGRFVQEPHGVTLPPGKFPGLRSVRGWVDTRDIVRLEGLGQLKIIMTSSEIEPETFLLVSIVSAPTTLPCAPHSGYLIRIFTRDLLSSRHLKPKMGKEEVFSELISLSL